jgi:hypothetical protein
MKELTHWTTVTDWHLDTRIGEANLPKEEGAMLELVNGAGEVWNALDVESWPGKDKLNPPYKPTKFVCGPVFLQEYRNGDQYARKLLGLTENSVVFDA